jgi:predicted DNA-binding transcriptional regulator YafY
MSSSLLTMEEVADRLKISPRAVYKYRQRLGGFYLKTNYPGVFYIEGTSPATGKPEKIFYIRYSEEW